MLPTAGQWEDLYAANFSERRHREVLRTRLPRTPAHKKGSERPLERSSCWTVRFGSPLMRVHIGSCKLWPMRRCHDG